MKGSTSPWRRSRVRSPCSAPAQMRRDARTHHAPARGGSLGRGRRARAETDFRLAAEHPEIRDLLSQYVQRALEARAHPPTHPDEGARARASRPVPRLVNGPATALSLTVRRRARAPTRSSARRSRGTSRPAAAAAARTGSMMPSSRGGATRTAAAAGRARATTAGRPTATSRRRAGTAPRRAARGGLSSVACRTRPRRAAARPKTRTRTTSAWEAAAPRRGGANRGGGASPSVAARCESTARAARSAR